MLDGGLASMFSPMKSRWLYEHVREHAGLSPHELSEQMAAKGGGRRHLWTVQEIDRMLWQLEDFGYLRQEDDCWFYAKRWTR